jgi:glycosyltransferase involved in cell wall biosynthesis
MGESDLLVWPAIDEAFGVVFIEAQACGLPVIAGDSAGVAAVIDAGRTGLLAPLDDSLAFAMAIRRLASDRALGERMGIAASAHARVRHDIPAAAAALDSILRRVVRTRSANVAAHAE